MKILKITKAPQGMTVEYSQAGKTGPVTATCYGNQKERQAFSTNWKLLADIVYEFIETTPPGIEVRTVNFKSDDKGSIGAVLSCIVPMKENNRPWNFNTPVKYAHPAGFDKPGYLTQNTASLLSALTLDAEKYVNGEKPQSELFEGEKDNWESKKQ
ncbi:MAG: hypothetical protein ACE5I1_12450, partial [bacterium]